MHALTVKRRAIAVCANLTFYTATATATATGIRIATDIGVSNGTGNAAGALIHAALRTINQSK